jgi:hypothetical protein
VLRRFLCGLTAVDKLAPILERNPRGVLVVREELNGWLASFLRARNANDARDPLVWQQMHRAGSLYVERTSGDRGLIFIPRAAVSLTGVFSPGILSRVLKAELGAGLLTAPAGRLAACFLLAMPPQSPTVWSPEAIDGEAEAAFHELLRQLLELQLDDLKVERVPRALTLSAEATAAWAEFYNARQAELAGAQGALSAALGRLEAYAARLALIDHVVRCIQKYQDDRTEIGLESMKAGITLCDWFAAETRRVYAKLIESAAERNAGELVTLIRRRGGRISVRDLIRSYGRRYPDVATAEAALGRLVELGLGRWVEARKQKLTG